MAINDGRIWILDFGLLIADRKNPFNTELPIRD